MPVQQVLSWVSAGTQPLSRPSRRSFRLDLRFSAPSLPLSGDRFATALTHTFTGLSVGSFAENLSGSLSGTATLVIPPR